MRVPTRLLVLSTLLTLSLNSFYSIDIYGLQVIILFIVELLALKLVLRERHCAHLPASFHGGEKSGIVL